MAWVDITNAQVAAGAPITTALVTALRDNVSGLAARDSGAPKILGNAYNYQEFLTSGTWTKPANAESGDVVLVQTVAGGGAGGRGPNGTGGGGGGGAFQRFENIDDLGATETVVVGAGAAGRTSNGTGADGGASAFGTANSETYIRATGGGGGLQSASVPVEGGSAGKVVRYGSNLRVDVSLGSQGQFGGAGGRVDGSSNTYTGESSITGGGGAGGGAENGGPSMYAGGGGKSSTGSSGQTNGMFPGGGGGSSNGGTSGAGGDGVVRVWCIKEE